VPLEKAAFFIFGKLPKPCLCFEQFYKMKNGRHAKQASTLFILCSAIPLGPPLGNPVHFPHTAKGSELSIWRHRKRKGCAADF